MISSILRDNSRCLNEVASAESSVDLFGCGVKLVEDPELRKRFVAIFGEVFLGFERGVYLA